MLIGKVVGHMVSTQKYPTLTGIRLILVQPVDFLFRETGKTYIATDAVGAGVGEFVILVTSMEASFVYDKTLTPTDHSAIGIIDSIHLEGCCELCGAPECKRLSGDPVERCKDYVSG